MWEKAEGKRMDRGQEGKRWKHGGVLSVEYSDIEVSSAVANVLWKLVEMVFFALLQLLLVRFSA